jgi:DNA uptake protein ComE-like DNA-binding protein
MGLKDYFAFNKRQRNGVMVLLTIIAGMMIYLIVSDYLPPSPATEDFSAFKADMAKVKFKAPDTTKQIVKQTDTLGRPKKLKQLTTLELNTADSTDFEDFPLISPKVARTIVRFRNALGGYYDKKQLLEVYGMDTSAYNSMINHVTLDVSLVEKLNINKATEKALTHHPYIHKVLAKAIYNYRKTNGPFEKVSDIMKVEGIDKELYQKLSPYLSITN